MAKVKLKFRPSSVNGKTGTLYFQITHKRVSRQMTLEYKLFPEEWDNEQKTIVISAGTDNERMKYLKTVTRHVNRDISKFDRIIYELDCLGKQYSADHVKELFCEQDECNDFMFFARKIVSQLYDNGKVRTAEKYTTAIKSLARYLGQEGDVGFEEMNSFLFCKYEDYLKSLGLSSNSTSYYMRNLRAIYNRAVEQGLTAQQLPFKHVYTGIGKTVKRAVPLTVIRNIRDMDLTFMIHGDFTRDMFMFSFYTRGMAFVDMAFLKKSDLKDGVLTYRRKKTGQTLCIRWEQEMQHIIDKYRTTGTPYLLPIIKDTDTDEWMQYKNAEHYMNLRLKQIGTMLKHPVRLTTYVARHSWASIAMSKNVPVPIISEGMGHDSEKTTRIYLTTLDTSAVDKANNLIMKSLK